MIHSCLTWNEWDADMTASIGATFMSSFATICIRLTLFLACSYCAFWNCWAHTRSWSYKDIKSDNIDGNFDNK